MGYLTRHLEASREIPHGDRSVQPGERFHCNETDADYYLAHKYASEVKAETAKPTAAPTRAPTAAPAPAPTPEPAPAPPPAEWVSASEAGAAPAPAPATGMFGRRGSTRGSGRS